MSKKHESRHPHDDPEKQEPQAQPQAPEPAEADKLQAERDDLLARLQRVSADYLNYQKRAQRDMVEAREFANAELIKNLLDVLDDLERAIQAARANHSADDPLLVGTQLVYDKAMATLGRFGLSVLKAAGEKFDPHKHYALRHEPSDDQPAGVVLAELQKGYELKGRVLRPASVVVSQGAGGSAEQPPGDRQEEQ
jgi:molecular chaperone GrpE